MLKAWLLVAYALLALAMLAGATDAIIRSRAMASGDADPSARARCARLCQLVVSLIGLALVAWQVVHG